MNKGWNSTMLRKSRSKSRPSDYIQIGSRITRAKDRKITNTLKTNQVEDKDIWKVLCTSKPPKVQKSTNNIKGIVNLVKHYEENFLKNPRFSFITMNIREAPNKTTLMKIYSAVSEMGGFKEVTANSAWDDVAQKVSLGSNDNIFEIYKKVFVPLWESF